MGVGKSRVCRCLHERLRPSAYLDGDWCWDMNPFRVTEETKAMVLDNIGTLLSRFLQCSEVEYVIFGWVMHQQGIVDEICGHLPLEGVSVRAFRSWPRRLCLRSACGGISGREAAGRCDRAQSCLSADVPGDGRDPNLHR